MPPRYTPPQYKAPAAADPYYGDYSALAQLLTQNRTKPIYSVGQGLAEAGTDIVSAYFEKKAREEAEKKQSGDTQNFALAQQFAMKPGMTQQDANNMLGAPTPIDSQVFGQPAKPQERAAAAVSMLNPRNAVAAGPEVADIARQFAPPKPQYQDVKDVGLVQIPADGGAPSVAIAANKSPTMSDLGRLMTERDALPDNDPRRKVYEAEIANKTRPPVDPNANKIPGQENTFRDEFTRAVSPYVAVRDANEKVKAGVKADSAAGDMATIFAYMKILDPGSTVREGEYATAEQARGVPETILNLYNKTMTGQKLTAEQRKDFSGRAQDIVDAQKPLFDAAKTRYTEMAKRGGLNPQNIVFDYDIPVPAKDGASVGAPGAPVDYSKMSDDELKAALAARKKGL
jgi:hypothetical protein